MRALRDINIKETLFLDIETSTVVKELEVDTPLFDAWSYKNKKFSMSNEELIALYTKEAALYPEFGKIICICVGILEGNDFNVTTFNDLDESVIIREFYNMLDEFDDKLDKICGHAIKSFDIPYISKRSIINGICPHPVIDTSGLKPWKVNWLLDTKELWQMTGSYWSSMMSIAVSFGLNSSKDELQGWQVPGFFWEDTDNNIKKIAEYCKKDVISVYEILLYLKNLNSHNKNVKNKSFIELLFDGSEFGEKEKEVLKLKLSELSVEEISAAEVILTSMCSKAKDKKTKITNADVRELIKQVKNEKNYSAKM